MKLKLKIKVTSKDLLLFVMFCIVLLYLSSIAVPNVINIINEQEFLGFNPLPGLTKYLPGTLIVFFGVLFVIFLSVSSTIFDFTKGGPGIKVGEKDSDGYSRWMDEKEMKSSWNIYKVGVQDEDAEHGGVVFVNDGKNMWVDDSEYHTLVVGVTGSGKTSAVVDPLVYSLAKAGESMVFTDPKGEIYRNHTTYLKHKGYNIVVLNFRNPQNGNAWNPLMLPYKLYHEGNPDKAKELIDDVASNIIKSDGQQQDPFWQDSAADYLAGNVLGLIEDAKPEEVNINSVNIMTTIGEEKFGTNSTYIKEYFKLKGESSSAYVFASNTINSPQETKGGILSTFRQKIRLFASRDNLSEMLAYSDFDMADIGKQKTAVFIIVQDEKKTYHALATIFIKQAYEVLIDVAQNSPGAHLPYRTNFILDEFANMPALKDITTMVTAARSRHIRFTFIIQNYAQLDQVYGKEEAQTIRSNCANLMYLLTTELAALEEISKLCGEVKSKKDDKTASQPLITVADLQKLQLNEVIIIRNRQNPFRTKLKQAFNIDWGDKEWQQPAELPEREKKEVALFDVKNFVDVRKRSEMKKNGENSSPFGNSPFGGSSSFGGGSPFGGSSPFGGGSPQGGSAPSFSDIMSGGMAGLNSAPKKFPTFEEFLAERNKQPEEAKPKRPQIDIDDLVKKIDAQIARLEEEERQEKEKQSSMVEKKDTSMNPFAPADSKVVFEEDKEEVKTPTFEEKTNDVSDEKVEDINIEVEEKTTPDVEVENKPTEVQNSEDVTNIDKVVPQENSVPTTPVEPEKTVIENRPGTTFKDIFSNIQSEPSTINQEVKPIVQNTSTMQPMNFENMMNTLGQPTNNAVPPVEPQKQVIQQVVTKPESQVVQSSQTISQPTVKVDTESQVINNNTTTDDQYFDDFFQE